MGRSSILLLVTVGYGWKYVTVDLSGLVRRYWDAGEWQSKGGVVRIECKGQSDVVMERVEVAEDEGQYGVKWAEEEDWEERDRMMVLFRFYGNMYAVKWVVFGSSCLRSVFSGGNGRDDTGGTRADVERVGGRGSGGNRGAASASQLHVCSGSSSANRARYCGEDGGQSRAVR